MIKGCSKRVIVMKETGSDMIEEAFFIIKPSGVKKSMTDADIMTQAKMLIEKGNASNRFSPSGFNVVKTAPKNKPKFALPFTLGLVLGAILSAALILRLPVC